MTGRGAAKTRAIEHCRKALALLVEAGDVGATAKLQTALDHMVGAPVSRTLVEADAMLEIPEALEIVRELGWDQQKTGPTCDDAGSPPDNARFFGDQLSQHRKAAGLTQARVAEKTRFATSYISLIERGRANPTLEAMAVLADAVGAKVWALLPPSQSLSCLGVAS